VRVSALLVAAVLAAGCGAGSTAALDEGSRSPEALAGPTFGRTRTPDAGAPPNAGSPAAETPAPEAGADAGILEVPFGRGAFLTCRDLSALYETAIATARQCDATKPVQCAQRLPAMVGCRCMTFVEATNADEARRVMRLWRMNLCVRRCPDITCPPLASGVCTDSGCVDNGP
jgi:hypothetical protein